MSHLAKWLVDLEKQGRLTPPVELTVYSGESEHLAVHFHYEQGRFREGDLSPVELEAAWPPTVRSEDALGNVSETSLDPEILRVSRM
jgi:hypothetical protein